jgi:CubicO group peptidase (beta-lactamase class C family)
MQRTIRLSRRAAVQAGLAGIATTHLAATDALGARTAQPATPEPSAGATADRVAQAVDALDGIVTDAMDWTGVPGISVAVVHDDEALAARGYGVASTETGDPVNADTIFQIASLSKPLASTVVASIVGHGIVTWDTPVARNLPGFALNDPWVTGQVTIRDMFSHRSGLPDHAGDALEDIGYDRDEVLHRLRYQPLAYGFRSGYAYTNFGLTAGAVSAARAAGATWEDACDERLYEPAGMTRTSSRFDDFINADNHAAGHVQIDGAWVPEYVRNPDPQSPAGGVSSTATDMATWMRLQLGGGMLDGQQIVDSEALAETHRPQVITNRAADHASLYGLGWNVGFGDGNRVTIGHSGAFALGTGTAVSLVPAEGLGIVVLTNGAPVGAAEAIVRSFLDIARTGAVQADYVAEFQKLFAGMLTPLYGTAVDYISPPAEALPPQGLEHYTGTYANNFIGPVVIAQDGDRLTLSQGPQPQTYPLTHWNRDTFTYLPIGENFNAISGVTFTIGPDGAASRVTIEALDTTGVGTLGWEETPG